LDILQIPPRVELDRQLIMDITKTYDIACIGNYTKDTIITPAGVKYVDGGAINYSAHAAAKLGCKVAVITRLASEDRRVIDKFTNSGIDCFATFTPSSTCMKLEYPTYDPDTRSLSVTSTAGSIPLKDVTGIDTKAAVIGTSLRGEVGVEVIHALHNNGVMVAVDMQGFVRVLRERSLLYEPWDEMKETLADVAILKSDAVEAEFLTGEADIFKAAQTFARMGPNEIILTHKDGLLVLANGEIYQFSFYSKSLDGRSGRGDTCIGAYVAMRMTAHPSEAGLWAAAITSLKMETLGPFNRSINEVQELIDQKYALKSPFAS
jgi:sugar/nucleoside kinase (ribokinase family)